MSKREKPSTRARREGYAQLNKLHRLFFKLFLPDKLYMGMHVDHWVQLEFNAIGWRDYMVRYIPEHKRGRLGIKSPSKRRRRREVERRATIR